MFKVIFYDAYHVIKVSYFDSYREAAVAADHWDDVYVIMPVK
jgi:hypothetical protein